MSDALLELTCPGPATPKGRPRLGNGRTYTPAATVAAEQTVGWRARRAWPFPRPTTMQVAVEITLHLLPRRQGDVDNYAKLLLDALQGIVYANDRQVRRLVVERLDAPDPAAERTAVTVRPYSATVSTTTPGGPS